MTGGPPDADGSRLTVTREELTAAREAHRRSLEAWRQSREEMRWASARVAEDRAAALVAFAEREAQILAAIREGKTLAQLTVGFHASRRYLVRLRALLKSRAEAVPRDPTSPRTAGARPDESGPSPSRARERARGNMAASCVLSTGNRGTDATTRGTT
jgi:hypothetical protein